ncbi:TonB-dependent receptor [Neolewinella sp.]|uniref:TonB-dependent receptor n=1 Tax=Neolewinella sp. TaxID=2993543 RepID=UPI003B51EB48
MQRLLVCSFMLILSTCVRAQACTGRIVGTVIDEHENEKLAFATIYMLEGGRGAEADYNGYFELENVCAGPVSLRFSHIGCDPKELTFDFTSDTTVTVYLHHHDNYTETVTVTSSGANVDYEKALDRQSDRQISEVLEGITGVSSLRTGTAAAKPVFDGLYGNRLSIQNNGIAQAGQQWGNDHAPEIDPWVAAYVRVVEGVDALRYGGSTLGPTVLIEPATLTPRTASGGTVAYGLRSNGLAHTLNARLTDSAFVAYRLSGSLKLAGDQRAPDYYLTNTGRREGNMAVQLAKFINPELTASLYYSLYSANVGVLRGSHIGNLTDLEEAIGRQEPYFTSPDFSYSIASPRQTVIHHLLKGELDYRPDDSQRYTLRYGGQIDDRREYDVRRGDDNRAALKLLQTTQFVEGVYRRELAKGSAVETGAQYEHVDNVNQPGTGVLPLIPDYTGRRASAFATYHYEPGRLRYHFGLRYDRQYFRALTISRDLPRRLLDYQHTFNAVGGAAGASLKVSSRLSSELEFAYRQRPPQINELYSQGLHQGVSGIEEGDSSLTTERSTKVSLGLHYGSSNGDLTLTGSVFAQRVANFINLEPQPELRLTIRGAFPLFKYRGIDGTLYGAKFSALAQLGKLEIDSRLALLYGQNRTDDVALVYIPPTNWRTRLGYTLPSALQLSLTSLVTARQGRITAEQDFLPPPPGYALFDVGLSRDFQLGSRSLSLLLEAENVLNTSYRDYLDRQRYYADAPGRSLNIRISYAW